MKKIKNKIKDDFINNLDVDLKFDTSKLKMSNDENKQKKNRFSPQTRRFSPSPLVSP